MNFDLDDILRNIANIVLILIGISIAVGGFALAIMAVRYALGGMA